MRELVTHPDDLSPRDAGFGGEQGRVENLDRLTDLDQPDPDGIEDQTLVEIAVGEVLADGRAGGADVL